MTKTLYPPRDVITLRRGKSAFSFFPSGDVCALRHDGLLINAFVGSPSGGCANRLYLRALNGETPLAAPLTGLAAAPVVERAEGALRQRGEALGVAYEATFELVTETLWLWRVRLRGQGRFDLLYGQDLGMAEENAVRTNELYASQYLGHTVEGEGGGRTIRSRQNLPQRDGRFPVVRQGMLAGGVRSYCTDTLQFFGLGVKRGDAPAALTNGLPGAVLQYEGAYVGLQSEPIDLRGKACVTFFGQLCADERAEDQGALAAELSRARGAAEAAKDWRPVAPMRRAPDVGAPYASPALSRAEAERLWPERRLEETAGGELYGFFTGRHTHVALAAKETACRRPHGTILMSAQTPNTLAENVLASTVYMPGVFASQTVIGNTSFHKGVSAMRGTLNLQSHSGVRLYVRMEGRWRLLTMPAAFEMTVGGAAWHYLLPGGDRLTVNAFVRASEPDMTLTVQSLFGRAYDFRFTCQWAMGEQEGEHPVQMTREGNSLTFGLPPEARTNSPYPGWHMTATMFARDWTLTDDRVFFADGKARDETLTCVEVPASAGFAVQLHAALAREAFAPPAAPADPAAEAAAFEHNLERMTGGLRIAGNDPGLERLRALLPWYVHNASVHMASPHGLEQPGGAAWGTRDVCQGPFELLCAFGHYALARQVLLRVYAHQSARSGQWPQWFMFDRYPIAADSCHGDVFLWPLKCVADYLLETGDDAVLAEPLPYADRTEPETLLAHVGRAAALLSVRRQPGRALLTYAGGDWDDTLQPADPALAEKLVSSWTQALACQTARRLGEALKRPAPELAESLRRQADDLSEAFSAYLVRNGQIAGFLLREGERDLPLLHPEDSRTGLRCRLLPLTRSIIAELVDADQARRNVEQIDRYLACPDGVRLMDRPANYDGGRAKLFRRAEQAANVGREIGLMYVHAHIRYVEAMAKLGLAKRAWEGMLAVAPPLLNESVPNALPRQSNLYFSSSDGDFADRYAFAAGYDRLRAGTVGVLGGWRLYSSGPGIYLRTLTECVFGVRRVENDVVIDPVLPAELTGCALGCTLFDRPWTLRYRLGGVGNVRVTCAGRAVPAEALANRYRPAGVRIARETLAALPGDTLEIHVE